MASSVICTDKGVKRDVNQDACTIQVADTAFGEMILAVICDGVGGLSAGELASSTVICRFERWFQEELPSMVAQMSQKDEMDFDNIQAVWRLLLNKLNSAIQAYARVNEELLGTTFTGLFMFDGKFLVGHVGDCRVYLLSPQSCVQITKDQTLLAEKLSVGEISPKEAVSFTHRNVILQSVGTERVVKPVFYQGAYSQASLFLLCTDGAYRRAEQRGLLSFFESVDYHNESALMQASKNMLIFDIQKGEKDNLTVACISPIAADTYYDCKGMRSLESITSGEARLYDTSSNANDLPTTVGVSASMEDNLPTLIGQLETEDDLPTMVGRGGI